jgi:hypothetical protein
VKPHDAENCEVCQAEGTWSTTADQERWFAAHDDAGIILHVIQGKVMEGDEG